MTYVGKILVLLIMAMSLVFLGVSVTAFVTATNWKEATAKKDADLKKVQGQLATRESEKKDLEAKLPDGSRPTWPRRTRSTRTSSPTSGPRPRRPRPSGPSSRRR